jgi:Domain of unknown function (DUF5655)/Domain of unknown function (DUF4287)
MAKVQPRPSSRSPYDVHPGVTMVRQWIERLPQQTGRSLEQWIELVQERGPADEKERRLWLKTEHKLGTNSAWWIAERAAGKGIEDGDPEAYLAAAERYVEALYAGPKAALRPLHERLVVLGRALGDDVKICPCQTMVPFYRKHVVAQIKPTTRTRIDLGLALARYPDTISPRLIDTGGAAKNDRITHRIPIAAMADIDPEVETWLARAWDLDA